MVYVKWMEQGSVIKAVELPDAIEAEDTPELRRLVQKVTGVPPTAQTLRWTGRGELEVEEHADGAVAAPPPLSPPSPPTVVEIAIGGGIDPERYSCPGSKWRVVHNLHVCSFPSPSSGDPVGVKGMCSFADDARVLARTPARARACARVRRCMSARGRLPLLRVMCARPSSPLPSSHNNCTCRPLVSRE